MPEEQGQSTPENAITPTTPEAPVQSTVEWPKRDSATPDPAVVTPSGTKGQFTQEDLNKAAGNARSEARERTLSEITRELGVADLEAVKAAVKSQQEAEEANRSEAEKLQKQFEKSQARSQQLEEQLNSTLSRAQQVTLNSEARLEALNQSVKPERVNAVLKLAELSEISVSDEFEVDSPAINAAIAAVLEEYPEFVNGTSKSVGSGSNPPTEPPNAGLSSAWDMTPEEYEATANEVKLGRSHINPFR